MTESWLPSSILTRRAATVAAGLAVVAILMAPVAARAQVSLRVPTLAHFAVIDEYNDGDFVVAAQDFLAESRNGGIKFGVNRWIDSICYHAMAGEAFYQLGKYGVALENYNAALQLFIQHQNWMVSVQFSPTVAAKLGGNAVVTVPWGQTKRASRVGQFPNDSMIQQGQLFAAAAVIQRGGGVLQNPQLIPCNVQEVVRCTAVAIRRRRDIMGPLCANDPFTHQVLEVLARRPGQPNHWSECWIDVQLGIALSAAGKDAQAKTVLERSLVAAGEYDHPLTALALLELARLALMQADFATAEKLYEETTYAAVNFNEPGILEEAFRYGMMNHLMANRKGMYPPLEIAAEWARRSGPGHLQASLYTLCAENAAVLGQTKAALDYVAKARFTMARSAMLVARIGARLNVAHALAHYQTGQAGEGDAALNEALKFQRGGGSIWLFQISLLDGLYRSAGALSPRVALDLYTNLLRDPTAADWLTEPLDALSKLSIPHPSSYENWFDLAIGKKDYERALEVADLARRHRFLSAMEFGGRILNLRWLLESAERGLDPQSVLQRQSLSARFVGYQQTAEKAHQLTDELKRQPIFFDDATAAKKQATRLAELAKLSQQQEVILREIAVRREPAPLLFPPSTPTRDVQKSLTEGQAVLAFYTTSSKTHAFLMTNERFGYWELSAPKKIELEVKNLLRELGNWEQNKQLKATELDDTPWKRTSMKLLDLLMRDSKIRLPYTFRELIIVPDNLLWYVPFESLHVTPAAAAPGAPEGPSVPLLSQLKVRYAPLVALAGNDPRPRRMGGNTAVVLGRLYPQDAPDVTTTAYAGMERALIGPQAIQGHLHASSGMLAALADRMVVLAEIVPPEKSPLDWSPVPLDANTPMSSVNFWMALPWAGPEQVVLPGFRTNAENALKKNQFAGQDLFLAVTSLMASGARTVLISRWRPGGQSSYDLVTEFMQELPHTTAAEAWQRSVLLLSERPLQGDLEPRINTAGLQRPLTGKHPFFWGGFLLADTGAPPTLSDEPVPDKPPAEAPLNREVNPAAAARPPAGAAPPAGADAVVPPPAPKP